jgi:hypothetical protein
MEQPAPIEDNKTAIVDQPHEVLLVTHAHVHWRSIAQEFSSLLDTNFVDVVFRVRCGRLLAVHRAVAAAAWPSLREDLSKFKMPSLELRVAGLSWFTSGDDTHIASQSDGAASNLDEIRSVSPDIADRAFQDLSEMIECGVFDVSSRSWGSWNIVRALCSHLYCRPVSIHTDELIVLRNAAASLGCLELARLCDHNRPIMIIHSHQEEGHKLCQEGDGGLRHTLSDLKRDKARKCGKANKGRSSLIKKAAKVAVGRSKARTTCRDKTLESKVEREDVVQDHCRLPTTVLRQRPRWASGILKPKTVERCLICLEDEYEVTGNMLHIAAHRECHSSALKTSPSQSCGPFSVCSTCCKRLVRAPAAHGQIKCPVCHRRLGPPRRALQEGGAWSLNLTPSQ